MPEEGGLGAHLTLDLAGQAKFGPDVEWVDSIDYTVHPERAEGFYHTIRRYWPTLPDGALQPSYSGVQADHTVSSGSFLVSSHHAVLSCSLSRRVAVLSGCVSGCSICWCTSEYPEQLPQHAVLHESVQLRTYLPAR